MNNEKSTSNHNKGGVKNLLKARGVRRGTLSLTVTVLIIAAIVLLNIIVATLTSNHEIYLDVTSNSSYRLQATSTEYLSEINKPVSIYVLQKEADFESGDSTNYKYYIQANKLIHAIAESSSHIDLRYVDVTSEPTFTSAYPQIDWTKKHIVLVECGDLYRAVDLTDLFTYDEEQYYYYGYYVITGQKIEQSLITAIVNVTTEDKTKIAVLTGQGEQDMSAFTTLLENNAYEVETVSLLTYDIPEDSEFIIIYDPDVDIDTSMYTTLSDWLNNDGKFGHHLFYFPNDQHDVSEYPNLNALMSDFGMQLRSGYIYENDNNYLVPGYNHYFSVFDYSDETEYTEDLHNPSIPVVMSLTMPIEIEDSQMAKPLLQSSEQSFFFPIDLSDEEKENFEPSPEVMNGAAIGIHNDGTEGCKNSSMVVIGSYDSVTSNYLSINSYNNASYFVNLFNTLSDREDTGVVIEGKNPSANELGVTSAQEIAFTSILVRFVIPIGVLIAGLIIWIRRRHR